MLKYCKLPLSFDPSGLQADLKAIQPGEWTRHFNTGYFDGIWSGVALIAPGGRSGQLYSDVSARERSRETALGARCPHLLAALATFRCPIKSARLLKLGPGADIREHRDYDLGPGLGGEVRIHVPIVSNADVDFILGGTRVEMHEGECWYLDLSLPHRVHNGGATERIHLVLDCVADQWLKSLVPFDDAEAAEHGDAALITDSPRPAVGQEAFEHFYRWVLDNATVQMSLRGRADRESFVSAVIATGRERGYQFSASDVDAALQEARRSWLERWI